MDDERLRHYTRANQATWNASAPLHGQGPQWDALLHDAAQPGFCVLDDCLRATLQGLSITGLRAAQIGCNNARELLSLASLGAQPCLGVDQSPAFLAQGAQLAAACAQTPRLVCADIYALPPDLGTYDMVLITIGVVNWMPDLERFFRAVRGLLQPGGWLVVYETHPVLEMFEPTGEAPHVPQYSYFEKNPLPVDQAITYDGSEGGPVATGYWFIHTLGDIVTACVRHGLRLQRLQEHPHLNREVDYAIYENQPAQLPLCYTLVAQAV